MIKKKTTKKELCLHFKQFQSRTLHFKMTTKHSSSPPGAHFSLLLSLFDSNRSLIHSLVHSIYLFLNDYYYFFHGEHRQ